MATTAPADVLDRAGAFGTLAVGAPADVAVLRIEEGAFRFADAFGAEVVARQRLVAVETLKDGRRTSGPPAPAIQNPQRPSREKYG